MQIFIRSYELGVLFVPSLYSAVASKAQSFSCTPELGLPYPVQVSKTKVRMHGFLVLFWTYNFYLSFPNGLGGVCYYLIAARAYAFQAVTIDYY